MTEDVVSAPFVLVLQTAYKPLGLLWLTFERTFNPTLYSGFNRLEQAFILILAVCGRKSGQDSRGLAISGKIISFRAF
jgi:hypothetical protein